MLVGMIIVGHWLNFIIVATASVICGICFYIFMVDDSKYHRAIV